jgi:hypothetical protein
LNPKEEGFIKNTLIIRYFVRKRIAKTKSAITLITQWNNSTTQKTTRKSFAIHIFKGKSVNLALFALWLILKMKSRFVC